MAAETNTIKTTDIARVRAIDFTYQFPHLTVETVLSNSIRKVHTKTPFFRLFTVGKRG